jgi:hypothetical protein
VPTAALSPIAGLIVFAACSIGFASSGHADVYINKDYPIDNPDRRGNSLSPPHIAATAPTTADGRVILPSAGLFQVYGSSERRRMMEIANVPLESSIRQRWLNTGGTLGLLGHPQGDLQRDQSGGVRQDFKTVIAGGGFGEVSVPPSVEIAHGMCDPSNTHQPSLSVAVSLLASPKTGVHYVVGEIRDKFLQGGGLEQFGYPLTDEVPTRDGFGLMTRFERGTIFWYPGQNAEIGEPKTPPLRVVPMKDHH